MAAPRLGAHPRRDISQVEKVDVDDSISPTSPDFIPVSWDGPSDPTNPCNWSQSRKWFVTILTSLGGLVTLMSGAMLAPALTIMGYDLKMSEAEVTMALSIYVLAFAFGPMVLAPCSEVFGRRPIWIYGSIWYILWNTLCGVSKSRGLMITGRLMSGLGASAEFAVSSPIGSDCWNVDERGKSIAIRTFIPLIGPALGPILGGIMTQAVSWRWLFFVLSIFDSMVALLFVFFLPETHAQTLLSRKARALRKSTGERYFTESDITSPTLAHRIKLGLLRPTRLLVTQPIIQLISLVFGYNFGLLYIVNSTFSTLWTERYRQSTAMSGLHYIAIVIGCLIGSQGGSWATDRVWAHLKEKNDGETKPENRVPLLIPGAILMPMGLLWYGWSAQQRVHWIVSDIGIAAFACGYISGTYAVTAYVIESFPDYTASASAASQLLRSIFAFAFPIFGPSLYSSLGYGIGNTVIAAVAIGLGVPAPYILWKYGEKLRKKGKVLK